MSKEKVEDEEVKMEWRDYVAFVIALLTTHLLPVILVGILMIILSYFIVQLFG